MIARHNMDAFNFKEKIREFGVVEQNILNQIERWWDKYSSPLREIKVECLTAEKVMNKFLRKLRYE